MATQIFGLSFDGYWCDEHEKGLPALSGIYCVYTCVDHPDTGEVLLNDLIYIGEADDVRAVVARHEKRPVWEAHRKNGEKICYSYSHVSPADRRRCAAAMIFRHQPSDNDDFRREFPFDTTTISLNGHICHLHANFTVERTTTENAFVPLSVAHS